jgi:hypothetical protein
MAAMPTLFTWVWAIKSSNAMKHLHQLFILLLLFFSACKKESCLGEAGAETTVSRPIAPFHEIDLYDNIHVVLTQDTIERITISAPQNIEPNITTTVENGVLTLRNEAPCTWLRSASEKITVYVHLKKLDKILYAGSGNVTSTNTLITDNITFYSEEGAGNIEVHVNAVQTFSYIMHENADITLHGTSERCWSYTNDRGSIDFSDFVVKQMVIEYGSVRDATINVTEDLNSIIYYKGNLFYKGTPVVTKDEVHSTGRLVHVF